MPARTLSRRTGVVLGAVAAGGALILVTPLIAGAVTSEAPAPKISAKGATLVDTESGEQRYEKAVDTARPMASTVKIMVASVVLDKKNVDLKRKVTVQQEYRDYVQEQSASTADLRTGDKVSVRQLLYASLLPSGADAAYALADTFGTGDTRAERVRSFVAEMNKKAQKLHLRKTKFHTFDGTGKDAATPAELAELTQYALENSTFRKVVKTKKYKGDARAANGRIRTYTWNNTNQLLDAYDGVIGIKTGTTTKAGECLVFAATRDDKTFVGTVLNSKDRYQDAGKLLDYGFGDDDAKDMKIREQPSEAQQD